MDLHQTIVVREHRISYNEQNPAAEKTIFFIHGNSGSSRTWKNQFSTQLLAGYRLVAFDLPGHGQSAPFTNREHYNLLYIAELMASAVKACARNDDYILAGFSLGTNILAEMLVHNLRPKGVVLISPCIVGRQYPLNAISLDGFDSSFLFTDDCPLHMIDTCLRGSCMNSNETDLSELMNDYRRVQTPFRSMLLKTVVQGKISDQITILNQQAGVPLLVIFGMDEKVIDPNYLDRAPLTMWNHTIYKIPGANHFVMIDRPNEVNKLVAGYCEAQLLKIPVRSVARC